MPIQLLASKPIILFQISITFMDLFYTHYFPEQAVATRIPCTLCLPIKNSVDYNAVNNLHCWCPLDWFEVY